MDITKDIREITIQGLVDVGQLAFEYGDGYIVQGEPEKGKVYKEFAVGALMLAYDYDKSKKAIASTIADFAEKLGDKKTSIKYKSFNEQ